MMYWNLRFWGTEKPNVMWKDPVNSLRDLYRKWVFPFFWDSDGADVTFNCKRYRLMLKELFFVANCCIGPWSLFISTGCCNLSYSLGTNRKVKTPITGEVISSLGIWNGHLDRQIWEQQNCSLIDFLIPYVYHKKTTLSRLDNIHWTWYGTKCFARNNPKGIKTSKVKHQLRKWPFERYTRWYTCYSKK